MSDCIYVLTYDVTLHILFHVEPREQTKSGFPLGLRRQLELKGWSKERAVIEIQEAGQRVTFPTLMGWLQGHRQPRIKTLNKLCEVFDCSMDELCGRVEPARSA